MSYKLIELVEGDFRNPEILDEVQQKLMKIPFIKGHSKSNIISFETLESLVLIILKKYGEYIGMQWIVPSIIDGHFWYSCSIIDEKTHERLVTIYGLSMKEMFSKIALYLWAFTRKVSDG